MHQRTADQIQTRAAAKDSGHLLPPSRSALFSPASVCLSVCLSVCPSVCLSVHLLAGLLQKFVMDLNDIVLEGCDVAQ